MKHRKVLPHFCNEPLRCPECVQRFWIWAENHTNGIRQWHQHQSPNLKPPTTQNLCTPDFYEAAGRR